MLSFLFHPVSQEWSKRADKASLLTASGMLLHAFPSMSVSSLHEFLENFTDTADSTVLQNICTENY
jgi:hypothetical protein